MEAQMSEERTRSCVSEWRREYRNASQHHQAWADPDADHCRCHQGNRPKDGRGSPDSYSEIYRDARAPAFLCLMVHQSAQCGWFGVAAEGDSGAARTLINYDDAGRIWPL